MSGSSYDAYCPNCGTDHAQGYTDHKPHDYVSVRCCVCGFYAETETGYMSLEEINEEIETFGYDHLEKLTELPHQDPEYGVPSSKKEVADERISGIVSDPRH